MTESDLVYLLGKLGFRKVKARSRWVSCECPWASKNHGGGVDEHPSFAISVGDFPHYKCQACGVKGPLTGLIYRLAGTHPNREYWSKVFQWVVEKSNSLNAIKAMPAREEVIKGATFEDLNFVWGKPDDPDETWLEKFKPTEIDETQIGTVLPMEAVTYLTGPERRLHARTIKEWGLGYWAPRKRVTIPMRDYKGILVGVSGRTIVGAKPKFLHTAGFKRDYFLFGEHMIDPSQRTGYIVEGHFDVIYLWQIGYRSPVALMGTFPSKYQLIKMKHFFDKLIIIPDADKAGEPMPERVRSALPNMPIYKVILPDGKDLDELNVDDLHDRIASATQISS